MKLCKEAMDNATACGKNCCCLECDRLESCSEVCGELSENCEFAFESDTSLVEMQSKTRRLLVQIQTCSLSERVGDLMEDEVILMSPPGATGSKRHRFCKVEHNGKSYWVDLTATRRLRGIDSARLYTLKDGRLIVARLVRVSVLRSQGVI